MSEACAAFYLALIGVCAAGALWGVAAWRLPKGLWPRVAEWWGMLAFALSLLTWILRWRLAGHLPIFGTYESALSLALTVLAATLLTRRLSPASSRLLWPVACAVAAGLLAHGQRYDRTAFPLTISERSLVVDLHAVLAWAAFGVLAVNAGLALVELLRRRQPSAAANRRLSVTLSLGFLLHSAMLASGSFYKFLLFGRAWSFDPIETLGFAAWAAYGTLLHMHWLGGWQGRRLAAWCIGLFLLLIVSYRAIVYFPPWSTYHILDMDLRIHVPG